MSPRIAVCVLDEEGHAALPGSVSIGGTNVSVWAERFSCPVGGLPGYEYRHPTEGRLVVLVTIAEIAPGLGLVGAWVPALGHDGENLVYDAVAGVLLADGRMKRTWPVAADGTIPAIEADESPWADAVLGVWPDTWRAYAAGDVVGNVQGGVPPGMPTGPRWLGIRLA